MSSSVSIPSPSILHLISLHLLSLGLTNTATQLQSESGVGLPCSVLPVKELCRKGSWGEVLAAINRLDKTLVEQVPADVILDVQEMTVLELLESSEMEMAKLMIRSFDSSGDGAFEGERKQRIDMAFVSNREMADGGAAQSARFYGTSANPTLTKQQRRDYVGTVLAEYVPTAPEDRLVTLLNQAVKWQQYTGTLPALKPVLDEVKMAPEYDLVVGSPPAHAAATSAATASSAPASTIDRSVATQYGVIKSSKKVYPSVTMFLPSGAGIVTASSDGFVEIYDTATCKLDRTNYAFQARDEIMLHDASVVALAMSNDGEMLASGDITGCIKIWDIQNGTVVRSFPSAHSTGVLSLTFSSDGTKIFSGSQDGLVRCFGLRSSKLVMEYTGHASYVNCVALVSDASSGGPGADKMLLSGSSDGTIKLWHVTTGECIRTITPPAVANSTSNNASIQAVLPIVGTSYIVVVPRGNVGYVMNVGNGEVVREFRADKDADFVAATLSSRSKFVYCVTTDNVLQCVDVATGQNERCFDVSESECKGISCHGFKNVVATWEDGGRGKVKLWVP
jgi:WD40 repeat-containing protein SMU1